MFGNSCDSALESEVLAPGEFFQCEKVHTISQDQIDNEGIDTVISVAGTAPSTAVVVASASRSIPLLRERSTALKVTLSLDNECPGSAKTVEVDPTTQVTVCFELENTGNSTINSVRIMTSTGDTPRLVAGSMPLLPRERVTYSMVRPFAQATKIVGYAADLEVHNPFPPVSDNARVNIRPGEQQETTTTSVDPGNMAATGANSQRSVNLSSIMVLMGLITLGISQLLRRRETAR